MYFTLKEQRRGERDKKAQDGDEPAKEWLRASDELGKKLHIKVN
jgi:hypothetical protein